MLNSGNHNSNSPEIIESLRSFESESQQLWLKSQNEIFHAVRISNFGPIKIYVLGLISWYLTFSHLTEHVGGFQIKGIKKEGIKSIHFVKLRICLSTITVLKCSSQICIYFELKRDLHWRIINLHFFLCFVCLICCFKQSI